MPDSAIASGFVDLAIPADQMGAKLVEFAHGPEQLRNLVDAAEQEAHDQTLEQMKSDICVLLRNRIGHDFSGYKTKTFMRRVQRRMQVTQLSTAEPIWNGCARTQEVAALFRDLLINVTNFFRDSDAFDSARRRWSSPSCLKGGRPRTRSVSGCPAARPARRCTRSACSCGSNGRHDRAAASADLRDRHRRACAGVAGPAAIPRRCWRRLAGAARAVFRRGRRSYVVRKDVRELCIFSPHNLIRDPPFSRMDLMSCRNLLIYFGATSKIR